MRRRVGCNRFTEIGNYQICSEGRIQSVFVMNEIDDWDDEERPLLVKVVQDGE